MDCPAERSRDTKKPQTASKICGFSFGFFDASALFYASTYVVEPKSARSERLLAQVRPGGVDMRLGGAVMKQLRPQMRTAGPGSGKSQSREHGK